MEGGYNPTTGYGIFEAYSNNTKTDKATMILNNETSSGWSGKITRLKIIRTGELITCYSSAFNDTSTFLASSKIEINLKEDWILINGNKVNNCDITKYNKKCSYGYFTNSQPESTYIDSRISGTLNDQMMFAYFDDGFIWKWDGSKWIKQEGSIQMELGYPRYVKNPITGNRYYIEENKITKV